MPDAANRGLDPEAEAAPTNATLLSEVAATLLLLPFEERTRDLHIRALRLKRQIDPRVAPRPSESEARATRESILALRRETAERLATR